MKKRIPIQLSPVSPYNKIASWAVLSLPIHNHEHRSTCAFLITPDRDVSEFFVFLSGNESPATTADTFIYGATDAAANATVVVIPPIETTDLSIWPDQFYLKITNASNSEVAFEVELIWPPDSA